MSIGRWLKKVVSDLGGVKNTPAVFKQPKSKLHNGLAGLASEQRDLSSRFNSLMERLEGSLDDVAGSIKTLNLDDSKAVDRLKKRQELLRLAMVRLEATLNKRSEVERELSEWERVKGVSDRDDALLISLKTEIFRSEIALRNALESRKPIALHKVTQDQVVFKASGNQHQVALVIDQGDEIKTEPQEVIVKPRIAHVETKHLAPEAEHLVRSIRELSAELAKHEQSPQPNQQELASMTRQISELHAILRSVDKKFGRIRDRISVTDGFRHVFQQH